MASAQRGRLLNLFWTNIYASCVSTPSDDCPLLLILHKYILNSPNFYCRGFRSFYDAIVMNDPLSS